MSRFCAIFKRFSNIPAIADRRSQTPVLYAGHIEQKRFQFGNIDFAPGQYAIIRIGLNQFADEDVVGIG